jgi:molybdopterin-guanine dinucleotide biosynthesis protein A
MRLITTDVVVVTAVDLPFAAPALSRLAQLMMAAPRTVDAVVPMVEGRSQPLCAAYRTRPLAAAIQGLGAPAGRSVRDLIAPLTQAAPTWSPQELQDVDSPADLAAVEEALRQQGRQ